MAIYVYLPLVEMAEEWKRLVDKAEEDGDSDRLLSKLGVDPRETDIVKAIKRQL